MENRKNNNALIGVLIVIIVILLFVVCYLLFGKKVLNKNIVDNNTTTTTTTLNGDNGISNDVYDDLLLIENKLEIDNFKVRINAFKAHFSTHDMVDEIIYDNVKRVYIFTYPEGTERWIYIIDNNGDVYKSEMFYADDLNSEKLTILISSIKKVNNKTKIEKLKEVYTGEDEVGSHFGVAGIDAEGNVILQ